MAEDTDSVGNQTESAETPNEAYKSLQRKLEASRRRERALMEQNLAQVEIQAQLEALTSGNQAMLRILEKSGIIEEGEMAHAGGVQVPPEAMPQPKASPILEFSRTRELRLAPPHIPRRRRL